MTCKKCGSTDVEETGGSYVLHGKSTRTYRCHDCGYVFDVEGSGMDDFFGSPTNSKR